MIKEELEWAVLGVRDKGSFEPFLGVVCHKMYFRKVTEMKHLGMTFLKGSWPPPLHGLGVLRKMCGIL